jgi:hypothetical protein
LHIPHNISQLFPSPVLSSLPTGLHFEGQLARRLVASREKVWIWV